MQFQALSSDYHFKRAITLYLAGPIARCKSVSFSLRETNATLGLLNNQKSQSNKVFLVETFKQKICGT